MANIVDKIKQDITFEKVLSTAIKTPGVKINRASFLRKELKKYCTEDVIIKAIKYNPAQAGIEKKLINKISKNVIDYETNKVTAISVAASVPGSFAAAAAIPAATADITSFFAFILRIVQELAYLYGFEEFDFNENDVDSETMNTVLVFVGVMFGVQGAAVALHKLADTMAAHVAKKLAQKALTKGVVYPIVKEIAGKIGVHMTKQVFADTVASAIPLIGAVLSGGITYAMFKPNCNRLRKNLMSYNLCDPGFYKRQDIIDAEFSD